MPNISYLNFWYMPLENWMLWFYHLQCFLLPILDTKIRKKIRYKLKILKGQKIMLFTNFFSYVETMLLQVT